MVKRAAAVALRSFLDPVDLSRSDPVFIVDTTVLKTKLHGFIHQKSTTKGPRHGKKLKNL